jgi:hypothetical protein
LRASVFISLSAQWNMPMLLASHSIHKGEQFKNENAIQFKDIQNVYVISGSCRKGVENCVLLGYYAASSGNSLPTFRDSLTVSSRPAKMEPIGCSGTSLRNYLYSLRNSPEQRSSHIQIWYNDLSSKAELSLRHTIKNIWSIFLDN